MAVPTLPKKLQNSLDLAKSIYNRWRKNILKQSGIKVDDWPEWDDVDDDQRLSLVDAVQAEVLDLVNDYKTEVEVEAAWGTPAVDPNPTPLMHPPPQQNKDMGVMVQYPCYVCAAVPVGSPGDACSQCSHLIKRISP
jgi:hypothetical protein